MLAKVNSCAVVGMEAVVIEVEVDYESRGLRSFIIVGLPDTAVQESRERVQAAIKNSGLDVPAHRLTVNLAPASIRKEGPAYDLPIAIGALLATRQLPPDCLAHSLVIGGCTLRARRQLRLERNLQLIGRPPACSACCRHRTRRCCNLVRRCWLCLCRMMWMRCA